MRTLAEGGFEAIRPRLDEEDRARKELFALIREDPVTSQILHDHHISDTDLDKLYGKLVTHGAGVPKKGHWVAASSLAFGQTLHYVFRHKDDDYAQFGEACYGLRQYFSDNETGTIDG